MGSWTRARYATRKANRQCVDCQAGLQPSDSIRCVECMKKQRASRAKYQKTEGGKECRRREYARKVERGQCQSCPGEALPGKRKCEARAAQHKTYQAAYLDRRDARST